MPTEDALCSLWTMALWGRCRFTSSFSQSQGMWDLADMSLSPFLVPFCLDDCPPPCPVAQAETRLGRLGRCLVWAEGLLLWAREFPGVEAVRVAATGEHSWGPGSSTMFLGPGSRRDLKLGCGKLQKLPTWSQGAGGCCPEAARNGFPERPWAPLQPS